MKALTHNIFSVGLGLFLVLRVEHRPALDSLLVVGLAVATNAAIDVFGHRTKGGIPVRSFATHSIFTAPVWGIGVSLASLCLLGILDGAAADLAQTWWVLGLGVVIAYAHLFLDALTEGGIYYGRHRVALAHLSYDNWFANAAFAALGALFIATAFF